MRWLLTPSIAVLVWAWGSTGGGCAGLGARSLAAGPAGARAEDCTIRPPGGDPPPVSANDEGARATGTRTRGVPSPACLSRGGAATATGLLIYLFPMCAPRCHGNRSIFSGVGKAPLILNLTGTEMAKRLRFLLAWGIPDALSPSSGPFCRDVPALPAQEWSSTLNREASVISLIPEFSWAMSSQHRTLGAKLLFNHNVSSFPCREWKSTPSAIFPHCILQAHNLVLLALIMIHRARAPRPVHTPISRASLPVYVPLCFFH